MRGPGLYTPREPGGVQLATEGLHQQVQKESFHHSFVSILYQINKNSSGQRYVLGVQGGH